MRLSFFPHEGLPVETQIQILRNAIAFLEARWPNGEVAMKLRDRKLEPGEDTYLPLYVLTKPFVGAFAACVFYVLLSGDIVSLEAFKTTNGELGALGKQGPTLFGFGFLVGPRGGFPRTAPIEDNGREHPQPGGWYHNRHPAPRYVFAVDHDENLLLVVQRNSKTLSIKAPS